MQNSSRKQKSDVVKLSLTLFVIAGVMALLVAFVNNLTAPIIEKRSEEKITVALKEVMTNAESFEQHTLQTSSVKSTDGKDVSIDGAWFAKSNGDIIGVCVKVSPQGYGGVIETIVGIDMNCSVKQAKIVSMSETSGIGTKIQSDSFLTQFNGKLAGIVGVSGQPENNQIQVISGATKSSKAYLRGINAALEIANQMLGGEDNE